MLAAGIDIGSSTIEVVLCDDGIVLGTCLAQSGATPADHATRTLAQLLAAHGLVRAGVGHIVATGFGRHYCVEADRAVSEITCHAAGVLRELPGARTVIEIGGQDSKMISLDERGRVQDFVMNDRCAAGTGRFIETVARVLGVPVEMTGDLALRPERACEISSMCAVFAETEIIGLLHRGVSAASVMRGVFNAVARRVLGMSGRIELRDEVVFTGGVALNAGVRKALEHITGRTIRVPSEPQFTGALGAAILAAQESAAQSRIRTLREAL